MSDRIYVDRDYALAAIKFRERWRFFYDVETMFLLDYSSFDPTYEPSSGKFRYGTLIVDESNAEAWMAAMAKELDRDQLPHMYWDNSDRRVQPTFVIDFDKKLWVGHGWSMDQSPLQDYQPQDWTAGEDDVMKYLPPELLQYFE